MKHAPRTERKKYKKPEISRFPLRADEAVLGSCKSSTSAGPIGNCRIGKNNQCNAAGS